MSASRPSALRLRIAEAAGALAAPARIRIAAWGEGYQLTGPTGRRELAADLAGLWRAADRLASAVPDPLDGNFLAALEGEMEDD
jgi:hypothetical protein